MFRISSLLYSLISNPNLKVKSEDPLFNFIHDIFAKTDTEKPHTPENENYDYNLITFYELIEPKNLSSAKFCEFLRSLNLNELTNSVWQKLCNTFLAKNSDQKQSNDNNNNRYIENHPSFEFDGDPKHRFEGIIRELTRRGGGNVQDIGTVKVTASSKYMNYYPKYAVDFDDLQHYYFSISQPNSWLKFDFINRKIRPTSYSIRSRFGDGKGGCHLKSWVIEGSISGDDNDWKVIDNQKNVTSLDDSDASCTFFIEPQLDRDECYRFLRLRQTGVNTAGNNCLSVALEYFGSIIED